MTETVIHIIGNMGSEVAHRELPNGTHLSTFRLATTPRHYDRAQRAYVDSATNWLSVQCWRSLALNVSRSLHRGDPVVVVGKLRTQEWERDGVRSSRFILEATAVGHDLSRGVSVFSKTAPAVESFADDSRAALQAAQDIEDGSGAGSLATLAAGGERDDVGAGRLADAS